MKGRSDDGTPVRYSMRDVWSYALSPSTPPPSSLSPSSLSSSPSPSSSPFLSRYFLLSPSLSSLLGSHAPFIPAYVTQAFYSFCENGVLTILPPFATSSYPGSYILQEWAVYSMLLIAPVGNFTAHVISVKLRFSYPRILCLSLSAALSIWIVVVSTLTPASRSLPIGVVTVVAFALCKFTIGFAKVCEFHEAGEKQKRMEREDGGFEREEEERELIAMKDKSNHDMEDEEEGEEREGGVLKQDVFRNMGLSIQLGALSGSLLFFLLTTFTGLFTP